MNATGGNPFVFFINMNDITGQPYMQPVRDRINTFDYWRIRKATWAVHPILHSDSNFTSGVPPLGNFHVYSTTDWDSNDAVSSKYEILVDPKHRTHNAYRNMYFSIRPHAMITPTTSVGTTAPQTTTRLGHLKWIGGPAATALPANFNVWLAPTVKLWFDHSTLVLNTPNSYELRLRVWLQTKKPVTFEQTAAQADVPFPSYQTVKAMALQPG